jgi:hypothetical protein
MWGCCVCKSCVVARLCCLNTESCCGTLSFAICVEGRVVTCKAVLSVMYPFRNSKVYPLLVLKIRHQRCAWEADSYCSPRIEVPSSVVRHRVLPHGIIVQASFIHSDPTLIILPSSPMCVRCLIFLYQNFVYIFCSSSCYTFCPSQYYSVL